MRRTELKVVNDQIGSPTFTEDLAKAILEIIRKLRKNKTNEIYHYSSLGNISWYILQKRSWIWQDWIAR